MSDLDHDAWGYPYVPVAKLKADFPYAVVAPKKTCHYLKDWPAYQWCVERLGPCTPHKITTLRRRERWDYDPNRLWYRMSHPKTGNVFRFKNEKDAAMFRMFFG